MIGGATMRTFLVIIQFLVCLTLIISVLLQPGKSAGLSGSIAGGAEQLFAKVTTVSAVLFMVLSVVLVIVK